MTSKSYVLSVRGIEMMTPLEVPTQRRLQAIRREVMRTKEKPNLPVPASERRNVEKKKEKELEKMSW